MKSLLSALKTALPVGLTWLKDIAILADEMVIPAGVRMPFIGLKDGPIRRAEGAAGTLDELLQVSIILCQQILKDEATIMGDGDPEENDYKPGILDMAADVHGLLNENLLGLAGVQQAFCSQEDASVLLGSPDGSRVIQMKKLVYEYERTT